MAQDRLFYDDVYQVLSEVVTRVGPKEVAYRLWPTKKNGYAWLRECLDPDKPGKLDPQEFIAILKMGREIGIHWAMEHICDESGYERALPKSPEDERADLTKDLGETMKRAEKILAALTAMQPGLRAVR